MRYLALAAIAVALGVFVGISILALIYLR